jgi:hypothetical protein
MVTLSTTVFNTKNPEISDQQGIHVCHIFPRINNERIKIISCNEMILVTKTAYCSVGTEFLNIIGSAYCAEGLKIYFFFPPNNDL